MHSLTHSLCPYGRGDTHVGILGMFRVLGIGSYRGDQATIKRTLFKRMMNGRGAFCDSLD